MRSCTGHNAISDDGVRCHLDTVVAVVPDHIALNDIRRTISVGVIQGDTGIGGVVDDVGVTAGLDLDAVTLVDCRPGQIMDRVIRDQ